MSVKPMNGGNSFIPERPEFRSSMAKGRGVDLTDRVSGAALNQIKQKPGVRNGEENIGYESSLSERVSMVSKRKPGDVEKSSSESRIEVKVTRSSFLVDGARMVSSKVFSMFSSSKKISCDTSNTETDETSSLEEVGSDYDEMEIESTQQEQIADLENKLIDLCKELISIKSSQIPLKKGQLIEEAIRTMKKSGDNDPSSLETLQQLHTLHKQLAKYRLAIDCHVFPFQSKQEEIRGKVDSWQEIVITKNNPISQLCDLTEASFSLIEQKATVEEIDGFIKELENSNYKDGITLSIVKNKIAEKREFPNTAFHQVHLHFLETKRDFLESRMNKADEVIKDLQEKKESYKKNLQTTGADDPIALYTRAWNKLNKLLYNLPVEKKTPILERAMQADDFKVRKALREMVCQGETDIRLNHLQVLTVLSEIKKGVN